MFHLSVAKVERQRRENDVVVVEQRVRFFVAHLGLLHHLVPVQASVAQGNDPFNYWAVSSLVALVGGEPRLSLKPMRVAMCFKSRSLR